MVNRRKIRQGSALKRIVFTFLLFMIVVGILSYITFTRMLLPVAEAGQGEKKVVEIPAGSNVREISSILFRAGLIRSDMAFRLYVKYKGIGNKLKAGEYDLNTSQSVDGIIDNLISGHTATVSFTIPEGFTLKQIADRLEQKKLINREKFMDLVAHGNFNYDFLKGLPEGPTRLEGYLFPDTYRVSEKTTEYKIIDMMLKRFAGEITPDFRAKTAKQGLSIHQAVTLASIIEREAKKDEERPKVAAVFLNRLRRHWKLESCATVQYVLDKPKARLLDKDLRIESPYNTYIHFGLPIGPIASPGRASLQAAVNPANVDYMFFVVYEDGKHVFSRTLKEHNKNKALYLAKLKNS